MNKKGFIVIIGLLLTCFMQSSLVKAGNTEKNIGKPIASFTKADVPKATRTTSTELEKPEDSTWSRVIGNSAHTNDGKDLDLETFQEGWPQTAGMENRAFGPASVVDMDNDGSNEVITILYGLQDSNLVLAGLYAWHPDGTLLDGFPVHYDLGELPILRGQEMATIGDLDGDGDLELVLGTQYGIYAWDHSGQLLEGFPLLTEGCFTEGPLVLADIDKDGEDEIVASDGYRYIDPQTSFYLHVLNADGTEVEGWPQPMPKNTDNSLAVGDIDADGELDIAISFVYYGVDPSSYSLVRTYDASGNLRWTALETDRSIYASVSMADLDGDYRKEIIHKLDMYGNKEQLSVISADGELLYSWGVADRLHHHEPVIANMDADPDLEIIAIGGNGTITGQMFVWNYDGTSVEGWPIDLPQRMYSPIASDIDGDDTIEIINSLDTFLGEERDDIYVWHPNGEVMQGFPIHLDFHTDPGWNLFTFVRATLGDVDQDGEIEIITPVSDTMYVIDVLEKYNPKKSSWPCERHDIQHTSNYPYPTVVGSAGYHSFPAPGSPINLGTTNISSTISTTLTINEIGDMPLVITPTLSGADTENFRFTPTFLTIPDGGAAQDLTVECTPSITGTLTATLSVAHNAPDSPAVYPLTCIGEVLTRYIYLPLVLH